MIRDLGIIPPGTKLYIPFHTFDSNDPSASVTLTGLAVTDIEIYSNGGTTQRASDNGYALLDTDGIDFDAITGIHGLSIDLADNSTAGFWAAGSQYWVVIASVTVDAATINFVLATFRIGYPDAIVNTTIATLATQTSFTLTAGPAEDDALNGCTVCIHDVASAVQLGFAVISDYTGSTKTVTLTAGVTFTAATTDNISIFRPVNAAWAGAVVYTATRGLAGTALPAAAADAAGGLIISDAGGLDADDLKADVTAILVDTGTTLQGELDAIEAAVITNAAGVDIAADIIALKADTAAILVDTGTTLDGRLPAALTAAGNMKADALRVNGTAQSAGDIIASFVGLATLGDVANVALAVWDEATSGHQTAGTTGKALTDAGGAGTPPTAAEIADAVLDEALSGHTTAGTLGQRIHAGLKVQQSGT